MLRAGDQIGPYTLLSKLGRGSFGVVWLAERVTPIASTRVALKIPLTDDVDIDAVKREAQLWVRASGHANVLPLIEANIYDDQVVIASEYAPDGSLQDWLTRHAGAAPTLESAVEMCRGILNGLEHLHLRGIVHRDVKPDNILLQGDTPRLADFGVSRVIRTGSQSSVVAGTPIYMAPEGFRGKRNEQTDIWAVGVILYQLVSGRLPFEGTDWLSLMAAISTDEPAPLPQTAPAGIREVIERALSKERSRRYPKATDMRAALIAVRLSPVNQVVSQPGSPARQKGEPSAGDVVDVAAGHSSSETARDSDSARRSLPGQDGGPAAEAPAGDLMTRRGSGTDSGDAPSDFETKLMPDSGPSDYRLEPDAEATKPGLPNNATVPERELRAKRADYMTGVPRAAEGRRTVPMEGARSTIRSTPRKKWAVAAKAALVFLAIGAPSAVVIWRIERGGARPVDPQVTSPVPRAAPSTSPLIPYEFQTVRLDSKGQVLDRGKGQAKYFSEDLGGGASLQMVEIPGGTFQMGSPKSEGGRLGAFHYDELQYERPHHTIPASAFFPGEFKVTQARLPTVSGTPRVNQNAKRHALPRNAQAPKSGRGGGGTTEADVESDAQRDAEIAAAMKGLQRRHQRNRAVNHSVEDLVTSAPERSDSANWNRPRGGARHYHDVQDEEPQHTVRVPAFFMGKVEVTQTQWRAVCAMPRVNRDLNPDPSNFKGDDLPVEEVSWDDATEFCARLSQATGRPYRLPSEAEWEYACRARTTTTFAFGETITPELVNYDGHYPYAGAAKGTRRDKTTAVGSLEWANGFGLFDMHGNVWEWCLDVWHVNYAGAPADGKAWTTGGDQSFRVLRGGSWIYSANGCRSGIRNSCAPNYTDHQVGLRVVMAALTI
jgi:formylglycine-generating enzyme required for sulfatase activity/serine/threonine protein kinase